jgi:multidrug efflux pump subunit AcrA (membrane-fusion protein)
VQTATGTVTAVSTIATSTSGVATFPVVVTLDGTPSGFFAGSTAQVAITYNELPDVVQVPLAAITRSNGQTYVTVADGTKRSRREITIGITSGGVAEVTAGLQPDEQVVVTVPVATASNRPTSGGAGPGGAPTGGFPGGGVVPAGGGFRGGPNY